MGSFDISFIAIGWFSSPNGSCTFWCSRCWHYVLSLEYLMFLYCYLCACCICCSWAGLLDESDFLKTKKKLLLNRFYSHFCCRIPQIIKILWNQKGKMSVIYYRLPSCVIQMCIIDLPLSVRLWSPIVWLDQYMFPQPCSMKSFASFLTDKKWFLIHSIVG
jgi:hypothetical protein